MDMRGACQHIRSCTLVTTHSNDCTKAPMQILPTVVSTKEVALLHCLFALSVSIQPSHAAPFKPFGQSHVAQP